MKWNGLKGLCLFIVLCGISAVIGATTTGTTAEKETAKETVCKCGCRKCPPKGKLTCNQRGEIRYRSCFRDRNHDNICDNSIKAGRKCKNNCVLTPETKKGKKTTVPSPCENCPCPANCDKCALKPV